MTHDITCFDKSSFKLITSVSARCDTTSLTTNRLQRNAVKYNHHLQLQRQLITDQPKLNVGRKRKSIHKIEVQKIDVLIFHSENTNY